MIFSGGLAAIFLIAGAAFMFYYSHSHATHTGRMAIRAFFVLAPFAGLVGVMQYVLFTMEVGSFSYNAGLSQMLAAGSMEATWGMGFYSACMVLFLSLVPICVQAFFGARDKGEHRGDDSDDDDDFTAQQRQQLQQQQQQPQQANYGAAGMGAPVGGPYPVQQQGGFGA